MHCCGCVSVHKSYLSLSQWHRSIRGDSSRDDRKKDSTWQDSPLWSLPPEGTQEIQGGWQRWHPNHYREWKAALLLIFSGCDEYFSILLPSVHRVASGQTLLQPLWILIVCLIKEIWLVQGCCCFFLCFCRMRDRSISEQWAAPCVECFTLPPIQKMSRSIYSSTTSSSARLNMWWGNVCFANISLFVLITDTGWFWRFSGSICHKSSLPWGILISLYS